MNMQDEDATFYQICQTFGIKVDQDQEVKEERIDEMAAHLKPHFVMSKGAEKFKETLRQFGDAIGDQNLFGSLTIRRELCKEHQNQKMIYFCDEGSKQEHLCDLCLLQDKNKQKSVAPLSRIALDLVSDYEKAFSEFTQNMEAISKISPETWKVKLRSNILRLFEQLSDNF